jgi:hypothetical protein
LGIRLVSRLNTPVADISKWSLTVDFSKVCTNWTVSAQTADVFQSYVLWRLWSCSKTQIEELQRQPDLLSLGSKAVKKVWQTANLVRKEGFGAAVRNSIEDLADWAEVERPDLARVTQGQGGDFVLRHRGVDRAQRTGRRPGLGAAHRRA